MASVGTALRVSCIMDQTHTLTESGTNTDALPLLPLPIINSQSNAIPKTLARHRTVRLHTKLPLTSSKKRVSEGMHNDADDNVGAASEDYRRDTPSLAQSLMILEPLAPPSPMAPGSSNQTSHVVKLRPRSVRTEQLQLTLSRLNQLQLETVRRSSSVGQSLEMMEKYHLEKIANASTPEKVGKSSGKILILVDFDDTLFPTSHLTRAKLVGNQMPPRVRQEMRELETMAIDMLMEMMNFGRVVVVTNGSLSWVKSALAQFTPTLERFLFAEKIKITSTRSTGNLRGAGFSRTFSEPVSNIGNNGLSDDFAADLKSVAFRKEIQESLCSRVIVVGDSESDMKAARQVLRKQSAAVKRTLVKMQAQPTIVQLTRQLEYLADNFFTLIDIKYSSMELYLEPTNC